MDPICTFLFAFLVLLTTRAILRDISDILMERVPRAHNATDIQEGLEKVSMLCCNVGHAVTLLPEPF